MVPVSWARTSLHKAPVSKGEQGQEQFARAIDYTRYKTKKNEASEMQGSA